MRSEIFKKLAMKKVKQDNGWDEIQTRKVRFAGFAKRDFATAGSWVDYCQKYNPKRDKGRKSCQFCGVKWEDKDYEEYTALVQTTKGNKVLCHDCFDGFGLGKEKAGWVAV